MIKINININSFIEKTDKILFAVNTGKNIGYNSDFFGNSFYFIFTESTYKDKIKNSMKKFLNENIYENENKILFSSDNTDIFITIDCIENINNYAGEITKTGYFSEECIIKDTENFSRLIEKNTYDIKKYIDDFIINFRLFCLFLNNSKILTAHKYYIKAIENVNLINNYKDGEELYDLWFLGRLGKENLFYGLNSLYCGIDHFSLMNSREKLKNYFISSIDGLTDDKEKIEKDLIAENLGFENYRDYMHFEKARFDYTPEDIFEFHSSVEKAVLPVLRELYEDKKNKLGIDVFRPWDSSADEDGITLKPYKTNEEFVDKAIKILYKVKPEFGINLEMMKNTKFLDLENRKGKAPGGYCTKLPEFGGTFIFMNAVGIHQNVITLLHESGHAMHGFSFRNIPYNVYKDCPSEIAELGSMSMELITLDYLGEYYKDEKEIKKAKKEGLMNTLTILPWVMTVDAFQQWIYTTDHNDSQRDEYFASLMDRFNYGEDYSGYEKEKSYRWLRQLHIFEVPFYYIEYAISQLGAIAVYKNYKENGQKAVEQYHEALKLGYSKPIPEIYKTAGIKFDFSYEYIKELVDFIKKEIESL